MTVESAETPMDIMTDGAVLVLDGDLDVRSTWRVRTAVYDLLAGHDGDVVVDLTGVEAVDVTALRMLAVATRQAQHDGHRLRLRGCCPAVRRLLLLTHLHRLVEVERSEPVDPALGVG